MTGAELRRVRLKSSINEASALLSFEAGRGGNRDLLAGIGLEEGYWLAHDEGGLGSAGRSMLSIVGQAADSWSTQPVELQPTGGNGPRPITDAEALATYKDWVFVVGSGFLGPDGKLDSRRAFVTRFAPTDLSQGPDGLAGPAEILDLGSRLVTAVNEAFSDAPIELMAPKPSVQRAANKATGLGPSATPINIEGAACSGSSLLLGLRWPTTIEGNPLVVEVDNGAEILASAWNADTADDLAARAMHVHPVALDQASPKKPLGIRALSVDSNDQLHAVTGPTDRDIAAKKLKTGSYEHVEVDLQTGSTSGIETFEGYRKVEALAQRPNGSWLYGLDDEKAIVLLVGDE